MKSCYSSDFRLGILGGGQLGRMLIQEAIDLDVRTIVMDPSSNAPCAPYAHEFVNASFNDYDAVFAMGKRVDVLTIEIEHVNVEALEALEKEGVRVYPTSSALRIIQDKGLQKLFYQEHGIPTASFVLTNSAQDVRALGKGAFVQKMRTGGYDGKGVQVMLEGYAPDKIWDVPSVIEDLVSFEKELSVIVARNASGEVQTFPLVEMEFNPEANLVEFLFSPAQVSSEVEQRAAQIAKQIAEKLQHVGLLAVEMFLTASGEILVNEMAPRPHNSGHHTIEACNTSQYAQHLRAILDLPLGDTRLIQPAVMINLLGEKNQEGPVLYQDLDFALSLPGVHVHLYGKAETKPFRKMGHVTVTNSNLEDAKNTARTLLSRLRVMAQNS
jgi:5-(carboxyamino)imidazole ribonucleotide synthase